MSLIKYMSSQGLEESPPDIRLTFLQTPPPNHLRKTMGNQFNITGEILRASVNKSYIGQISGRKRQLKEDDFEDILPPIEEEQKQQNARKRINFSQFKDTPTSKIFKMTESRFQDIPLEKEAFSVIKEDPFGEEVELQVENSFFITNFTNKEKDLLNDPACLCSKSTNKQCKLMLINESTLEVYVKGEGPNNQIDFNQLLFAINFDTVKVELTYLPKKNDREFTIGVGDIHLAICHDKPPLLSAYFNNLQSMLNQCKGYGLQLEKLLEVDQFYKRRYETQEFFTKHVQTGDILLFEDTHFFAKAQRFFTRSDFDHVAVAIKDNNYGLLMFESMSGGVSLTPWRSVIRFGWFENIPRIVWRRLNAVRDSKFFVTVQKFIMENIEKSYHISFAKLTAQQSMIHSPATVEKGAEQKQKKQEEGFFCSELVATLYKELGLLTRDTNNPNYQPACTFYPKHFTTRSEKKLDSGDLSPEYDIFFDRKLLSLNYKFAKND